MTPDRLLAEFSRVADAPDAVPRLRRFVLDLAVRGKLVPQDPADEPASALLKRIAGENARLVKAGVIKEKVASSPCALPDDLPQGWVVTRLQNLCSSITDGDHLPPPKAGMGVPFLVIGNVRSRRIDFDGCRFVPQSYFDALNPISKPQAGDLLYTLVGSYGIPVVVDDVGPFCVQRHIGILRPSRLMDVGYLARVMESGLILHQATACATGIAQKTVPLSGLRNIAIPLPPLAEQHRIVAKVDELMALCDRLAAARREREATRDRLTAASLARLNTPDPDPALFAAHARFALTTLPTAITRPDQIKPLRQTILNLAVRGLLVPQDSNDKPPRMPMLREVSAASGLDEEVFEQARNLIMLPSGWLIAPLAQLSEHIVDCPHTTPKWTEQGEICIRTNQLRAGNLDLSEPRYVSQETYLERIERLEPRADDILYSREGGILGIACRVPKGVRLCLGQRLMLIRAAKIVGPDFLEIVLNSPFITDLAKARTTGGAAPRVNMSTVRAYPIPLPPLAEQHRIVARVASLMTLCDRLEASFAVGATIRTRLLEALLAEALAPTEAREEAA